MSCNIYCDYGTYLKTRSTYQAICDLKKLIDEYKVNGDFVESQAFAYLAVRSLMNLPISFPGTTGCEHPTTGGKYIKF